MPSDRRLKPISASIGTESPSTLGEYVERMPAEQDAIYYLTGPSLEVARRSPHLEAFRKKGWEVLLLTDPDRLDVSGNAALNGVPVTVQPV